MIIYYMLYILVNSHDIAVVLFESNILSVSFQPLEVFQETAMLDTSSFEHLRTLHNVILQLTAPPYADAVKTVGIPLHTLFEFIDSTKFKIHWQKSY